MADENRPVLAGLLALVGVAVAVGLVAALAVMAGTHMLGLTGGQAPPVAGDAGATLYVPKPQKTKPAERPDDHARLRAHAERAAAGPAPRSSKPKKRISLQAGQTTVAPMARIDLTGTYPGGEGAVLNVAEVQQRLVAGLLLDLRDRHQRHLLDLHPDRDARGQPLPGHRLRHPPELQQVRVTDPERARLASPPESALGVSPASPWCSGSARCGRPRPGRAR